MRNKFLKIIIFIGVLFVIIGCEKTPISSCDIAWDCSTLKSFTENYSDNFKKKGVYFIKGITLDAEKDGCNIKIIEDLKGNFDSKSAIFVWNSGSDIVRYYKKNDTLIMLLNICKKNDEDIDYTTLTCTYSVLKLSNGSVIGHIYPGKGDGQTAIWDELQKELKSNKK